MKKLSLISLTAAAILAITPATFAQEYDFSFTGDGVSLPFPTVSGSGSFDVVDGVVTSITGTFYLESGDPGQAMSLIAPGGFADNDNEFTDSAPYFDYPGISFVAGGEDYNLYDNPPDALTQNGISGPTLGADSTPVTLTVSAVPEYGSRSMLALCVLGLAGGFFFRARQTSMLLSC